MKIGICRLLLMLPNNFPNNYIADNERISFEISRLIEYDVEVKRNVIVNVIKVMRLISI